MAAPIRFPFLLAAVALTFAAGVVTPASGDAGSDDGSGAPAEVRVERVKPHKPKLPTLRFLKTNRAFVRARLDLLREKPLEDSGGAREMDPRFLAYRDLLASVHAAGDSVAVAADATQRRELFASINELGLLEAQLDRMGQLLADQRMRLGVLQEDFAGHQRSALAVVLSGAPAAGAPDSLVVTRDDGSRFSVLLTSEERSSLAAGGTLEVFHGLIEPREQVLELSFEGGSWAGAPHGWLTLSPERDRLTFLRLDLSPATPAQGAAAISASSWRHDADTETALRP
ncbi:MAG: hypothetical protein IT348_06100 [Candidatus Eisenbacteria bacterium]|nr:hypothetical protein [Candidatus Eisenbacteria bacterium]